MVANATAGRLHDKIIIIIVKKIPAYIKKHLQF